MRSVLINNRIVKDVPPILQCAHIRESGSCPPGNCYLDYLGSGDHDCMNVACPGHEEPGGPQCFGRPPVMLRDEVEDEQFARRGVDHRTMMRESGATSYGSRQDADEEEQLRQVMLLSMNDTQQTPTDDFDQELQEALRLSEQQSGAPPEDDLLAQAIAASRSEEARSREARGNFVTLATMNQRAKHHRLERGEDISDLSDTLRSKQYTGEEDAFATSPSSSSSQAQNTYSSTPEPSSGPSASSARAATTPSSPQVAAVRPSLPTSHSTPIIVPVPAANRAVGTRAGGTRPPSNAASSQPSRTSSIHQQSSTASSSRFPSSHASSSRPQPPSSSSSTPRAHSTSTSTSTNKKAKSKSKSKSKSTRPKPTSTHSAPSLPIQSETVEPFTPVEGHPEYNKLAAKIDELMNAQLTNAATGPSPAYTHTAKKGEKTAEFDADDGFVWQRSGEDLAME